jgi:hypothetical protein
MHLFRFDSRTDPLAPPMVFLGYFARNLSAATLLIVFSLAIGMAGYRFTEHMSWLDAYVNASMLLGGMGPVDPLHTQIGKFFAGSYALYCGLVVIITAGVVLAPILHRIFHALHVEDSDA